MSGGTLCKVSVGRSGGASNNALYITRASAVTDRENGVLTRHMDQVTDSCDFAELRTDVSSYFWAREEVELAQEGKNATVGKGGKVKSDKVRMKERQTRTHYRVILSFEHEVETEKAKAMVNEWLDKTPFKDAPAVAAIHRDTDHPHAHILIDARQVSGKKVDLSPREFRTLDEVWNEIYCREFRLDEAEHLAKKAEMREYKRAVLKAKREGMPPPERPSRSNLPERDKFASREARENKSVAADETWSAGRRFDRSVRRIERRIKSQFDVRYQLKRQLNPLIQIEGRVQALRRLGEMVCDVGKGLHDAYQRRVAVRESISQGGPGDLAEADARSGASTRADASRVQAVEGGAQRGSNREGASRSAGRAITTETEPIPTARRSNAFERAVPNGPERGAEQTEDSGTARGEARVGARAGQARSKGEFHLDGGNHRTGAPGTERSDQSAQGLTASAREDSYAASRLSVSDPPRAAGSEGVRVDHSGEGCGDRGRAIRYRKTELLGTEGASGARDSGGRTDIKESSLDCDSVRSNAELHTWSDEASYLDIVDGGFCSLRPEPQALPLAGEPSQGLGREVQTHLDIHDGIYPWGHAFPTDLADSVAIDILEESRRVGQSFARADPLGPDDTLCAERGVDEKYLQSSLLDAELKDRILASNDALLDTINQDVLAQINETAGQVIETEAESAEMADSAPILDFFL